MVGARPGGEDGEQARLGQALRAGQAEVGSQGCVHRAEGVGGIAGGVVPVPRPFAPGPVGGVARQRPGQRGDGGGDDRAGVLRVGLGDRQGADGEAAVADLVPVERRTHPPASLAVDLQPGLEPVADQPGPDGRPRWLVQPAVQPVVADPHRVGHLGGVEEVRRVPVLERADRQQVVPGGRGVLVVTRQPPRQGEGVGPAQTVPADVQQARAFLEVLERGLANGLVGGGDDVLAVPVEDGVGRAQGLEVGETLLGEHQAGVVLAEGVQDGLGLGRRRAEARGKRQADPREGDDGSHGGIVG